MQKKNQIIHINNVEIKLVEFKNQDYICLTAMTQNFGDSTIIKSWLRSKNTIEFLGIWEQLHNPGFNWVEFDLIKNAAGTNRFVLSANQWVEKTGAVGIIAKTGRYGGTYAHKDIAFEFGSWLSPSFKLLLLKEFQRLKEAEQRLQNSEWSYQRYLSKVNYIFHTDSIRESLLPLLDTPHNKEWLIYSDEADILNMVLFGVTAKQWREANPELARSNKNIRDVATIEQLTVLSNLESLNSHYILEGLDKEQRFEKLTIMTRYQLKVLTKIKNQQINP